MTKQTKSIITGVLFGLLVGFIAIAFEAVGKAEATANKLKLESFQGTGGENFTKIEVAKQVAIAFQNNKGYLPANMSINMLTDNFDKSVNLLLTGPQPTK